MAAPNPPRHRPPHHLSRLSIAAPSNFTYNSSQLYSPAPTTAVYAPNPNHGHGPGHGPGPGYPMLPMPMPLTPGFGMPLHTPMQQHSFGMQMQMPPGAPSRLGHGHRAAKSMAHFNGMPSPSPYAMGFPQNALGHGPPPPNRNRRQMSIGGPPKAVLGGPKKAPSALNGVEESVKEPEEAEKNVEKEKEPEQPPVKMKKVVLKLPSNESSRRVPIPESDVPEYPSINDVRAGSRDAWPEEEWRTDLPDMIDVFLPGKRAWDVLKQQAIEEKLQRLGVDKPDIPATIHNGLPIIHAPHARSLSVSSPADPALLLLKLNKLHSQQLNSGSASPLSPGFSQTNSPSPGPGPFPVGASLQPFPPPFIGLTPSPRFGHGHSLSLSPNPQTQTMFGSSSAGISRGRSPLSIITSTPPVKEEVVPQHNNNSSIASAVGGLGLTEFGQDHLSLGPSRAAEGHVNGTTPPMRPNSNGPAQDKLDFVRGFGLDTYEEEEEQEQVADDEDEEDDEEDDMDKENMRPGEFSLRRHNASASLDGSVRSDGTEMRGGLHVRHESRLSAALSMRSFSGLVKDGLEQLQNETASAPSHDRMEYAEEYAAQSDGGLDDVEELDYNESADESIGEYSNPSDEERARQARRLRRGPPSMSISRRLSEFGPGLGYQQDDDDVISNPSEEEQIRYSNPHSRVPSTAKIPSSGHSRQASLNPFAKPFVFGAPLSANAPSFLPPPVPPSAPPHHARTSSLGKPLNVAAVEFRPSFMFGQPAIQPDPPMPAPHDVDSDLAEEGDSMISFKFPRPMPAPAPVIPLRSGGLNPAAPAFTIGAAFPLPTFFPEDVDRTARAELGGDTIRVEDTDEVEEEPIRASTPAKKKPLPLDFNHPTVQANTFKTLASASHSASASRDNQSRKAPSRDYNDFEALSARELEMGRRPSLDDLHLPQISSSRGDRQRLFTDPVRLPTMSMMPEIQQHARRRSSLPSVLSDMEMDEPQSAATHRFHRVSEDMSDVIARLFDTKLAPLLEQQLQHQQYQQRTSIELDHDAIVTDIISALNPIIRSMSSSRTQPSQGEESITLPKLHGALKELEYEIRDGVADLVLERLDSRLSIRDSELGNRLNAKLSALIELHVDAQTQRAEEEAKRSESVPTESSSIVLEGLHASLEALPSTLLAHSKASLEDSEVKLAAELEKMRNSLNTSIIHAIDASTDTSRSFWQTELQRTLGDHQSDLEHKLVSLEELRHTHARELDDLRLAHAHAFSVAQKEHKSELEELRKQSTEHQSSLIKARGAHGQVRVQNDSLAEKLTIVEEDRTRLRSSLKEAQEGIRKLQDRIFQHEDTRKQEIDEKTKSALRVTELETRTQDLENALDKALGRLKESDVKVGEVEAERQALQTKAAKLEAELAINRESIAPFHAKFEQFQNQWEEFAERSAKRETEQEQQQSHFQTQLRAAREEADALTEKNRSLQNQIQSASEAKERLETRLVQSEERARASDRKARDAEDKTMDAEDRVRDAERQARDAEADLERLRTRYDQDEARQRQRGVDLETGSRERETKLRDEVKRLETKLTLMQGQLSTALEQVRQHNKSTLSVSPSPYARPDSRASTIYDGDRTPPPPRGGTLWDSMHNPANNKSYASTPSHPPKVFKPKPPQPAAAQRTPVMAARRLPFSQTQKTNGHTHSFAPPSPTPSTVSLAPTLGADGWWQ